MSWGWNGRVRILLEVQEQQQATMVLVQRNSTGISHVMGKWMFLCKPWASYPARKKMDTSCSSKPLLQHILKHLQDKLSCRVTSAATTTE